MRFHSIEDAFLFYERYAHVAGFTVRKSTKTKLKHCDTVVHRYFVCSYEGYKENVNPNNKKRKTLVTRCGCKARMVIKLCRNDGVGYEVTKFYEGHKHEMSSDVQAQFRRDGRSLNIAHMKMIVDNSKVSYCQFNHIKVNIVLFLIYILLSHIMHFVLTYSE